MIRKFANFNAFGLKWSDLSELIEAVANAEETKMEVISSEDMLYQVKQSNKLVEEKRKDMKREMINHTKLRMSSMLSEDKYQSRYALCGFLNEFREVVVW